MIIIFLINEKVSKAQKYNNWYIRWLGYTFDISLVD